MALLFVAASNQCISYPVSLIQVAGGSVACWVKPTTLIALQQFVSFGSAIVPDDNYYVGGDAAGHAIAEVSEHGSGLMSSVTSSNTMTTGAWHHVAAVWTDSTHYTIWLDGVSTTATVTTRNPFGKIESTIGAILQTNVHHHFLDGAIAYPAIWPSYALTPTDVANLYNSGSGANPRTAVTPNPASFLQLQSFDPYYDDFLNAHWVPSGSPTVVADPFTDNFLLPEVTAQAVSNLTSSSVTLNGNVITESGGGNSTVEGFKYGLTTSYGTTVQSTGSFSTGAFSQNVAGLAPGILYHYAAFSTNPNGSYFTVDQTFTTSTVAPQDKGEVLFDPFSPLYSGVTVSGAQSNIWLADNTAGWTCSDVGSWAGLDCVTQTTLTRVRYTATPTAEDRVLGSTIEGSVSDPTFVSTNIIGTVSSSVRAATGTLMNELAVSPGTTYRYYRAKSTTPFTYGFFNLEFIGNWVSGCYAQPIVPVVSPPGGNFDLPTVVRMTSLTKTATIYYTTDGTTPTTSSNQYRGPFVVSASTQINAISVDPQLTNPFSRVVTYYFLIPSVLFCHERQYDDRNWKLSSGMGSVVQDPVSGSWYMYLTDKDSINTSFYICGVNVYSSSDLRNWKYAGNICGIPIGQQNRPSWEDNRPQVFYNTTTQRYVLWAGTGGGPPMRVFTSPYPDGRQPWTQVAAYDQNNPMADGFMAGTGASSYDIGHFIDPTNGKTYLIYNCGLNNANTAFSELDPANYTNTLGPSACAIYGIIGEAHAMCYRNGTYFYMFSGLTGFGYNTNHYLRSTSPLGPWTNSVNPMQPIPGPAPIAAYSGATISSGNCYAGQTNEILFLPGRNAYIWIGSDLNANPPSGYYDTNLFLPMQFPTNTSFTISWQPGTYFDGTPYSPWSLDAIFPTVSGAPTAPTLVSVTSTTATWINNEPSACNLYLDSSADPAFGTNVFSEVLPPSSTTFDLTASLPNTYYRARTVNANGTGLSVVLHGSEIAPSVSTSSVQSIGGISAILIGSVDNTGNINLSIVGFNWGTSGSYGNVLSESGSFGVGLFSLSLSGLLPSTQYFFQAFGTNVIGTSTGGQGSFTTLPVPTVSTMNASLIEGQSATLNGSIISTGTGLVSVEGFNWGLSSLYTNQVSLSGSFSAGSISEPITGLLPSTTYHFQVFATNSIGTSVGADYSFTTLAIPTLSTLAATSITSSSAVLNGLSTSLGTDNILTSQGFNWGLTNLYGNVALVSGPVGLGPFSQNIEGLISGQLYHFQAFSATEAGIGVGSDLTFVTVAGGSVAPLWQPLETIMERAIGASESLVESDIKAVDDGGSTPGLLLHGAQSGDAVPDDMLRMYEQLYNQAGSIPKTTGLSYRDSLRSGGSLPYDGKA